MLLCPVVLWEDVIWELCSAEPGTEECQPPPKRKKNWAGKIKNSMEKSRIWQKCRDFSLWDPPLDLLGMFMVVNFGHWMCSPEGHSQPRGYNLHQARGGFGLQSPWNESNPVGQLNPHPCYSP